MDEQEQDRPLDSREWDQPFDFSGLDDDFQAVPPAMREGDLPDGDYEVEVSQATLRRSKAGNPLLAWQLAIISGPFEGTKLHRSNTIRTRENLAWLKHDLAKCGLELAKLSELSGRLDELVGVRLRVTRRTRGDFTNVFLNSRLEDDAEKPSPAAGEDG